jgi:aconitate hydratase
MNRSIPNPFGSYRYLTLGGERYAYYSLKALEEKGLGRISRLPYSLRILLENLMRHADEEIARESDVLDLLRWEPRARERKEVAFMPSRVLLQDFTGVPCLVDLAAMRDAMNSFGLDPKIINPLIPVDLVIDHSVQVDFFNTPDAFRLNVEKEYERNRERYIFLKWGEKSLKNFRIVPPGTGICHQVNLEYLSQGVIRDRKDGITLLYPDSLLGTDSHTTMINGLGIFGWGVGGIEAEAVMLGQPYFMPIPDVVGVRLTGRLREGVTPTDLVLAITELLRKHKVVGKFVEFVGDGTFSLSVADRATIANMAPEYGATMGFFPCDEETLSYFRLTGREELVPIIEAYCKAQMIFRSPEDPEPEYSEVIELDLSTLTPSVAGPRRPHDRIPLSQLKQRFYEELKNHYKVDLSDTSPPPELKEKTKERIPTYTHMASSFNWEGKEIPLSQGDVVISAITSCTNTSNPTVMIGAGLLARKAREKGLTVKPYIKTSLAPGSQVVTEYLRQTGLLKDLEALNFFVVGYGCTTCIGNSGPLPEPVANLLKEKRIITSAVLSGNRNFEARVHPQVRANFLASPLLVVAFALAGTVDIDLLHEPLGFDREGNPVYLSDLWPSLEEIQECMRSALKPELFKSHYRQVFSGDEHWQALAGSESVVFPWDPRSTYIRKPPFFEGMTLETPDLSDIHDARVLAFLGDSITTDHISPAGSIPLDSPAGQYLIAQGVQPADFNSYGARRGNHEVMIRGTFANIRLKNRLVPEKEGGFTRYFPPRFAREKRNNEDVPFETPPEILTIYEAAQRYRQDGTPLIIIAGKEYGSGSSRDWAAKGTALLGVRAVLAESFERIHRSNLVGMGVLPLEFLPGENADTLNLTGEERYSILGISTLSPRKEVEVIARDPRGKEKRFRAIARLDTPIEVTYYRNGGILPTVLRKLIHKLQESVAH